jgi:hypothetical protein
MIVNEIKEIIHRPERPLYDGEHGKGFRGSRFGGEAAL